MTNAQSTTAATTLYASAEQPPYSDSNDPPQDTVLGQAVRLPGPLPEPLLTSPELVFSNVRRLLRTVCEPEVAEALDRVGGSPIYPKQLVGELEAAVELHQALKVRYAQEYGDQFALVRARALDLRQEALAACHWNLLANQTKGTLGRITRSNDLEDLRHDLAELHELMRDNRAAFMSDQSFDVDQACGAIDRLRGILAGFRDTATEELRRLEARREAVVCRLLEKAQELRAAADYALRNQPSERRHLAGVARLSPEHVPLQSMIRALSAVTRASD